MNSSRLAALEKRSSEVVENASLSGGLLEKGIFTMGLARRMISSALNLGELGLEDDEWKQIVKRLVTQKLEEISEREDVAARPSVIPARKADGSPVKSILKRVEDTLESTVSVGKRSRDESDSDLDFQDHPQTKSAEKRKSRKSESQGGETAGKRKQRKDSNGAEPVSNQSARSRKSKSAKLKPLSRETIDDSDDSEFDAVAQARETRRSSDAVPVRSTKGRQALNSSDDERHASDFDEFPSLTEDSPKNAYAKKSRASATGETETKRKLSKTSAADAREKGSPSREYIDDSDDEGEQGARNGSNPKDPRSDSELSSVYDVPPSRKGRKSDAVGMGKMSKKKSGKKDPNEGLSSDEAKVADLKRIVTACGVRKQWTKEFSDCPSARSQISHLQRILANLGMKGQPTMGKARSLKEKRELAAELNDVQEFEASRGLSKMKRRSVVDMDDEGKEEGEGIEKSALDTVLDFLGDESD
ncbi:hypothetical protein P7C73_g6568, partial [Tremellales sp. Uapishka_1]